MADRYVFADEAGNFDFTRQPGASRYFVLATMTVDDCQVGDDLLELRRTLGWKGLHLDSVFHASEDPQAVRDEVFDLLDRAAFRVDATILEKRKYVAPNIASSTDRLFVAASSLGTKKKRGQFHNAVDDVVQQVSPCHSHRVAFWPMESDPCLQVADYCTWAIQRKWERGDTRSFDLIKSKVASEFDVWAWGS